MVPCKIRDLRFPGRVYMETLVSFRSPKWFHVYFVNFGSGKPHFFSFTFIVPVYQWLVFVDYMKKPFHSVRLLLFPCKFLIFVMVPCKIHDPRFPGCEGAGGGIHGYTVSFRSPKWFHVNSLNFLVVVTPIVFSFTFVVPVGWSS